MATQHRHLLSVAKAARLVGVRRSELQKRIKAGELTTFEGMLDLALLAQVFPEVKLDFNAELERVRQIQDKAFGKRILERILPEPEVLVARIGELGRELLHAHEQIGAYRNLLAQLRARLAQVPAAADSAAGLQAQLQRWLDEHADGLHRSPPTQLLAQQSRVLQVMAPHIRLLPSEHEFFVEGNDSILEAGLREGLAIDYGCSNGNCGQCKAKVISGQSRQIRHHDYHLSEWEKLEGYVLMCCHTPVTDMVLEAQEAGSAAELPLQDITAKVKSVEPLSADVTLLHLQTPRTNRLRFFAGQQVELYYADASVSLPVASCPCDDRNLQFHVDRASSADFHCFLAEHNLRGGNLRLTGPQGDFVLDDASRRPLLFLAMDGGFAPVKSLIEHAIAIDNAPHITVYRCSERDDFYLDNLCRSWTDALDNISYRRLDDAATACAGDLAAQGVNLQQMDIFAAGPAAFIARVRQQLGSLPGLRTCVL